MKTFLKRLSGILVVLVGLHLIVIGIENWRGARAFERWRAATIAAGEPQSLEQMAPPKVPDAENFAAHPAIAARISGKPQPEGPVLPAALSDGELFRAWEGGRPVDLAALQAQLKVTDLGPLLDPFAAQLRGVEEASLRPHSRLLGSYEGDDIPSLLGMRQLARVLSLRALLALRAGHSKAALADVLTILRVAKHLGPEPQLISQLLSLATLRISFQPIWEGLRDHRWNDAQLAQLQGALGDLDLLSGWRRCWTAEGLQFRTQLEKLARTPLGSRPPIFGDATGKNGKVANFLGQLILPNGWIYQNQIRMEQHWRRQYIEVLDPAAHRLDVRSTEAEARRWASTPRTPYTLVAKLSSPYMVDQNRRMGQTQSTLDQAFVACALERHFLARKAYPERLDELVPTSAARLPVDLFDGQALRYRRGQAQDYLLYSIGWDGLDQGGQVIFDAQKPARHKLEEGDWTWSQLK